MRGRKWSREQIAEVVGLYKTGLSISEIERRSSVSHKAINKYLGRAGIAVRGKGFYSVGARNPAWRGGRYVDPDGYVLIYSPEHPCKNAANYVREHRLVMEKKLGRYLKKNEVVDHRNGVKDDNRLRNLRLYAKNAEHLKATLKGKCPKWSEGGQYRIKIGILRSHISRRSKLGDASLRLLSELRQLKETWAQKFVAWADRQLQ